MPAVAAIGSATDAWAGPECSWSAMMLAAVLDRRMSSIAGLSCSCSDFGEECQTNLAQAAAARSQSECSAFLHCSVSLSSGLDCPSVPSRLSACLGTSGTPAASGVCQVPDGARPVGLRQAAGSLLEALASSLRSSSRPSFCRSESRPAPSPTPGAAWTWTIAADEHPGPPASIITRPYKGQVGGTPIAAFASVSG